MYKFIHMGEMGFPSFTIDENTFKQNQEKIIEERMEDMIHSNLKSGEGIT
jgi:hypothetical protein